MSGAVMTAEDFRALIEEELSTVERALLSRPSDDYLQGQLRALRRLLAHVDMW